MTQEKIQRLSRKSAQLKQRMDSLAALSPQLEADVEEAKKYAPLSEEKALELLIRIACREQRYACVENIPDDHYTASINSRVQNAKCPDIDDVLKRWREQLAACREDDADEVPQERRA